MFGIKDKGSSTMRLHKQTKMGFGWVGGVVVVVMWAMGMGSGCAAGQGTDANKAGAGKTINADTASRGTGEETSVAVAEKSVKETEKLREKAIAQIMASAKSADPFLRANAIEAAQSLPAQAMDLVRGGMGDEHPAVRFAALATIGKLNMAPMAALAKERLGDQDDSVKAAAIFALSQCGETVDLTPMAELLASRNAKVRANTAMLMGLMGDKSAVGLLKDRARLTIPKASPVREALTRLQFTEAILRLGDDSVLDAMRAYASFAQSYEVRVLAVQMIGELGDRRFEKAIEDMVKDPPVELQLAAAGAMARLGKIQGREVVMKAAKMEMATVRAQAATVLGLWHTEEARQMLEKMLADPQEQVRVAAAASLLKKS